MCMLEAPIRLHFRQTPAVLPRPSPDHPRVHQRIHAYLEKQGSARKVGHEVHKVLHAQKGARTPLYAGERPQLLNNLTPRCSSGEKTIRIEKVIRGLKKYYDSGKNSTN